MPRAGPRVARGAVLEHAEAVRDQAIVTPLVRAPDDDSTAEYSTHGSGGQMADSDALRIAAPPRPAADSVFERAAAMPSLSAHTSRKVLILFSGPKNRPDGLAAYLGTFNLEAVLVDSDPVAGNGPVDDLLNDAVFETLLARVQGGEFCCVLAAPPCSTFSVARHFKSKQAVDGGPPPVRTRDHPRGLPQLSRGRHREVERANSLVARTSALLLAAHRAGAHFILENPADHGDLAQPDRFLNELHAPIWLMREVAALQQLTSGETVTFPLSAFGAKWRKDTTLLFSPGLTRWLRPLSDTRSPPGVPRQPLGGMIRSDGTGGPTRWVSADSAAYPAALNHYLAVAFSRTVDEVGRVHVPLAATKVPPPTRPAEVVPAPITQREEPEAPVTQTEPTEPTVTTQEPPVSTTAPELEPPSTPRAPPTPRVSTDASVELSPPVSGRVPKPKRAAKVHFQRTLGPIPTRHGGRALLAGHLPFADWLYRNELARHLGEIGYQLKDVGTAFSSAETAAIASDDFARALLASDVPKPADPKNRREAHETDSAGWTEAEKKELGKHTGVNSNESFHWLNRSDLPSGRSLVKLVWVYKVKRDGTLKARLCVQGCSQVPGIDFDQTHCATMRSGSLRFLASLSARLGLKMRRWDFASAYLQGSLEEGEVVFCHAPPGYARTGSDGLPQVCKVVKPIYGMSQAGRRWQRTLFDWIKDEFGLQQVHGDNCVFFKKRGDEVLFVGVYVDDLACCFSDDGPGSLYAEFIEALTARFDVDDEGEISDLLAVEFVFKKGTVKLHQQSYVRKLVSEFGSIAGEPSHQGYRTPCDNSIDKAVADSLADSSERDPADVKAFQKLVGSFLYLSCNTRPDIAYAVGMLCRCMSRPTPELFECARRVLGYLEKTEDVGLVYSKDAVPLHGMSDSDWAVKHSTTGWVFMFNGAAISWNSSKQPCVALSSCEAEIIAASDAAKEGKFWGSFLEETGFPLTEPLEIAVDNTAARDLAYNPEHHKRTKHIDRRHFFIRELVENHVVRVPHVRTEDNLADLFTKPLEPRRFVRLRDEIMGVGAAGAA